MSQWTWVDTRGLDSVFVLVGLLAGVACSVDEPRGASRADASDALIDSCGVASFQPLLMRKLPHPLSATDAGASDDIAETIAVPGTFVLVEGPRSQCIQLDAAVAPDGSALVVPRDVGPFCRDCAQRNSAGAGSALFALPSDATSLASGSLSLRLAPRDCDTLTSVVGPFLAGTTLRLLAMRDPASSARGVLRASAVGLRGTWLEGVIERRDEGEWRALELDVSTRLDAGITVRFARRCSADGGELAFRDRDYAGLDAVLERAWVSCPEAEPRAEDPLVPVVASTCLRMTNALTGIPSSPQGHTTHIPGLSGMSPLSDAVLVAPASCGSYSPSEAIVERAVFVATVAHELGHYLGLYHSVEPGGSDDRLPDTDGRNLMNPNPLGQGSRGLSASQRVISRRHPAVRWPKPGSEACAAP